MENKNHFYSTKNREVKKRMKNNENLKKAISLFEKYNFTCFFRYSDELEKYDNSVITTCQDKRVLITANRSDEDIIKGIALILPKTMEYWIFNNKQHHYCIHSVISSVKEADIKEANTLINTLL